jgi:excisionase family DNA binding protein
MSEPKIVEKPLAVSLAEAAGMLAVSRRTVENYIRMRRLPARKLGRRTVVLLRDLENFLRRDQPSASPARRATALPDSGTSV